MNDQQPRFMLHFLKMLVQLLMAPKNGWEDILADNLPERQLRLRGFMPLLILCALSGVIQKLYHSDLSWLYVIENAVVVFVAFFVAAYIAEFAFSLLLIRDISTSLNPARIQTFIIYTLGIIALMLTLINCVPFSPVLILLPLYSIVVMRMGVKFLDVTEPRIGHFMFLAIGSIFVPVFVIKFLFGLLIG